MSLPKMYSQAFDDEKVFNSIPPLHCYIYIYLWQNLYDKDGGTNQGVVGQPLFKKPVDRCKV